MPATAAMDNETLDHLLSTVDDSRTVIWISRIWKTEFGTRWTIVSMKPIHVGTDIPHPEEARSAVSKDGDCRDLACGCPSRRPRRSQACADCVNLSAPRAPQDEAAGIDVIRTKETLN